MGGGYFVLRGASMLGGEGGLGLMDDRVTVNCLFEHHLIGPPEEMPLSTLTLALALFLVLALVLLWLCWL